MDTDASQAETASGYYVAEDVKFALMAFSDLLQRPVSELAESLAELYDKGSAQHRLAVRALGAEVEYERGNLKWPMARGVDAASSFRGFRATAMERELDTLREAFSIDAETLIDQLAPDDATARHWLGDVYEEWHRHGHEPEGGTVYAVREFAFGLGPPSPQSDWREHPKDPFLHIRYLGQAESVEDARTLAQERQGELVDFEFQGCRHQYVHLGEHAAISEGVEVAAPGPDSHAAHYMTNTTASQRWTVQAAASNMDQAAKQGEIGRSGKGYAMLPAKNKAELQELEIKAVVAEGARILDDAVPYVHPLVVKQFCLAAPGQPHKNVYAALDSMAQGREDGRELAEAIELCEQHGKGLAGTRDASQSLGR